jgi:hypothetical protein
MERKGMEWSSAVGSWNTKFQQQDKMNKSVLWFAILALISHPHLHLRTFPWFKVSILTRDLCFQWRSLLSFATFIVNRTTEFHSRSLLWSEIVGSFPNLRFDSQFFLSFPIRALISNMCSHSRTLSSRIFGSWANEGQLCTDMWTGTALEAGWVRVVRLKARKGPRSPIGPRKRSEKDV